MELDTDSLDIKIAGFRKTSLMDYPDNISTVLFTQGCNCRCPYCHNPGLIGQEVEKNYMDLSYFRDFLKERQHLLDGVVITGGEPTLQKDIIPFIKNIKNREMKVKLDTNGSRSDILKKLMQAQLIDYIALDIKAPYNKYKKITGNDNMVSEVKRSVELVLESKIPHEFRTTVVPDLHHKKDISKIADSIRGADKYYIQNFRSEITLDVELQDSREFPETKLEEFKKIAENYLEEVEIRN
ncbi:MAG: anaerobic ribonucleoside-triphosphate reductase activating protein [Bacillota bacterium]